MYPDPDDNPPESKAIRRAPISGDVVPSRPRQGPPRIPDDDPSDEDIARLDNPTRSCPECRKDVFDDAEVCYHCGHVFSREPRGPSKVQLAIVAIIILGFLGFAISGLF